MNSEKEEILLHDYFDNLLSPDEQKEFEEYLLDNIDLAIELGKLKNLQRNINNLSSNFSPPDSVIENIINSLLENDEKNSEIIDLDIDASQIESEEELESKLEEAKNEKKKKGKKIRVKKPISAKTKFRLKKILHLFLFLILITAIGYGYILYKAENKTTPWQVKISSNNEGTQTSQIGLNSIFTTKDNEKVEIQISNIAKIELSEKSKIKILEGTKSYTSIKLYNGNCTFIPEYNNQLFELKLKNIIISSKNSKFSIKEFNNSVKVKVETNYISLNLENADYRVPKNYEFTILGQSKISIPVSNNSSKQFRRLIESYNITENEIVLKKIIKSSTITNAFTLYYILSYVTPEYRELIINKLQKLVPLPPSTKEEDILMLLQKPLNAWWDEIYFSVYK